MADKLNAKKENEKKAEDNNTNTDEPKNERSDEEIIILEDSSKEEPKENNASEGKEGLNKKMNMLFIILACLLIIVIASSVFFGLGLNKSLDQYSEVSKAANVKIIVLSDNTCKECYDAKDIVDNIKSNPRLIISEEKNIDINSDEGKTIAGKYDIKTAPAVIVGGEAKRVYLEGFNFSKDALVNEPKVPPFVELDSGKIRGIVDMTIIKDSTCKECFDYGFLKDGLTQVGVAINNYTELEYSGIPAKSIVAKYNITAIPAIIVSSEIEAYDGFAKFFDNLTTKEYDGNYVIRVFNPPYINTTNGKMVGAVDVTYLSDSTCTQCYNVTLHRSILADKRALGMYVREEEMADVSSARGKELIARYNITEVPTVIVSQEASTYPTFEKGWLKIGSKEADGKYVFRNNELLKGLAYKNIVTGEIKGNATNASIS